VGAPMSEIFFSMGVDCPVKLSEKYAIAGPLDWIFRRAYMSSTRSCFDANPASRP
jgi:hypothetical protein